MCRIIPLTFCLLSFCGLSVGNASQPLPSDSTTISSEDLRTQRTTRMAAILPGAGQCMNRKFWKAPLVWGGMAYCISAIRFNAAELSTSRSELIDLELTDPTSIDGHAVLLQTAREREAFYRRQRDLSWFALGIWHLLGVLDAHVDANLNAFDVGEDLSMNIGIIPLDGTQISAAGLTFYWDLNPRKMSKFAR